MIAANIAPGARRHYFGFFGWVGHDRARLGTREARRAGARAASPTLRLRGVDADSRVLAAARDNAARAGLGEFDHASTRGQLADAKPAGEGAGFLATNPPYGVRLEDRDDRARVDEAAGRRAARAFHRLGCGDPRRLAGRGARARDSRRARAHGVERRARVPPAAPARVGRSPKSRCCTPARSARIDAIAGASRRARRCSATASRRTQAAQELGRARAA